IPIRCAAVGRASLREYRPVQAQSASCDRALLPASASAPSAPLRLTSSPLIASRSQIGELNFPDHAHVAVDLALDLILKHAAGLGQLAHHDEDLAAVVELAVLGTKRDLLTDDEFVRWHLRYLARPALLPELRGFLALPLTFL